jgi:hypothetical protein
MAGRGPQTFQKRQKEQARKEKQEEKRARRLQRKLEPAEGENTLDDANEDPDLADLPSPVSPSVNTE